jgi:3-oxoacyl-[acyl-carrier protein] reductase
MKYVSEHFLTAPTRFWEVRPDVYRMVIDTNVNGPFLMARAAVAPMLRAGWGRIVNVSMSRETMRRAGFSPYGPSKAALESETVIWAQDLAGTGVTVNAILPGGATATGHGPRGRLRAGSRFAPQAGRDGEPSPLARFDRVGWDHGKEDRRHPVA